MYAFPGGGIVYDLFEEVHAIGGLEGRVAGSHLVDEAAEAPPVDFGAVSYLFDHFRRQVLGSPADGHCVSLLVQHLRQAEIRQFNVPLLVQYDVLCLQAE